MNLARVIPSARVDFKAAKQYSRRWLGWVGEDIAVMQMRKLAAVWADAVADVPYYMNLVAAGKASSAIQVLDQTTFQDNEKKFTRLSGSCDQFIQTVGSTSNPIRFGIRQNKGRPQRILQQTTWIKYGYQFGAEIFPIWVHSHLIGTAWPRAVSSQCSDHRCRIWRGSYFELATSCISAPFIHQLTLFLRFSLHR